jgi:hypothetical protein
VNERPIVRKTLPGIPLTRGVSSLSAGVTTMQLVSQYRHFATDYRHLAAALTKLTDKQALELFATMDGDDSAGAAL